MEKFDIIEVARWMEKMGIVSLAQDGNFVEVTYESTPEEHLPSELLMM